MLQEYKVKYKTKKDLSQEYEKILEESFDSILQIKEETPIDDKSYVSEEIRIFKRRSTTKLEREKDDLKKMKIDP